MAFGQDEEMPDFTFSSHSAIPHSSTTLQAASSAKNTSQRSQFQDPTGLDDLLALEALIDRESFVRSLKAMEAQMKNKLRLEKNLDRGGRIGDVGRRSPVRGSSGSELSGRSTFGKQTVRAPTSQAMKSCNEDMEVDQSNQPRGVYAETATKASEQRVPNAMDLS